MPGTNAVLDYQAQLLFTAGLLQTGARVVVTSDDLTIQDSDYTLVVQRSPAGPSTIALPAASGLSTVPGSRFLRIFDGTGDAATNNITITGTGALINGAASIVINQNWGSAALEWMGTYWYWHQGASSSGSLTAHAPTHRAGGTDDLLSAPGPIGAGTPDTISTTQLTSSVSVKSDGVLLLKSATLLGGLTNYVRQTGLALATAAVEQALQYSTGAVMTLLNASANTTSRIGLHVFSATLANDATIDYDNGGKGGAMLVVAPAATTSSFGIVSFAQNGTTTLGGGPAYTNFSVTLTTAAKLNVGASGGKVRFENKTGVSIDVYAFILLGVAT